MRKARCDGFLTLLWGGDKLKGRDERALRWFNVVQAAGAAGLLIHRDGIRFQGGSRLDKWTRLYPMVMGPSHYSQKLL